MFLNDAALLWAIVQVAAGASGKLIRATSVIWTLQQLFWVLAVYWAVRTPLHWDAGKRSRRPNTKVNTWFESDRQGLVLIALVIVAGIVSPSFITTLWLGAALISREAVVMYERERAQQQQTAFVQQSKELAVERERTRIANDLHDTIGANLTAIGLLLEAATRKLNDHPAMGPVVHAQRLADDLLAEARRTVHNLRASVAPSVLHERIEALVQADRVAGLITDVQPFGTPRRFRAPAEDALFHVAQEGITNVRKHAQATEVVVHIDYGDPTRVRLVLHDNGHGSRSTDGTGGFGLQGLRERLHAVGGDLQVETAPGRGFKLTAEVPA